MALQAASRSGLGYPPWASGPLAVDGSHKRALAPLPILLLDGTVGGALPDVLVLLCLANEVVKDRSDRLLIRGMAGGDVEELLCGSWALTP